jgi:phosphoserine aminotransferase
MRVFNFSAGPAVLPEAVLQRAAEEMLDWRGSGMSVMEMSHRGKEFMSIAHSAEANFRQLLGIPSNYKVLFLQGGAMAMNALVPMNLLGKNRSADYVNTGIWSSKSISEAKKYCQVNVAASSEDKDFTYVPAQSTWKLDPQAAYLHICSNETIGGVEYHWLPDSGDVPLVADMSSNILSTIINVSDYAVIYGGAQKNIGPAGLTFVIVRDDLLDRALDITPTVFHWKEQAEHESMVNTPPTYGIYMAVNDRSRMNIPFHLHDTRLNDSFLDGAQERGLLQLKGHRSVGGMRASLYNAMPIDGVIALINYLRDFEKHHA